MAPPPRRFSHRYGPTEYCGLQLVCFHMVLCYFLCCELHLTHRGKHGDGHFHRQTDTDIAAALRILHHNSLQHSVLALRKYQTVKIVCCG